MNHATSMIPPSAQGDDDDWETASLLSLSLSVSLSLSLSFHQPQLATSHIDLFRVG